MAVQTADRKFDYGDLIYHRPQCDWKFDYDHSIYHPQPETSYQYKNKACFLHNILN